MLLNFFLYSFDKSDSILREAPDSFHTKLVAVFVMSSDYIAAGAQLNILPVSFVNINYY